MNIQIRRQLERCEGELERAFKNAQRWGRAIVALIILLAFSFGLFAGWMLKGALA